MATATLLTVAGCSLPTDTTPSRIVIPPTDELSTITEVESASTTTTTREDRADNLPDWTIGRVVALAPRVDNSRFHQGSVSPDSPIQDSSGFHFSTPDRSVNCSTGTSGTGALACRINNGADAGPTTQRSRPADTSGACDWRPDYVILTSDGPQRGACANRYPVLYRSSIVDFGHTISVSRFSCLVETVGLFCLESRSKSGFSVTENGYRTIYAADRAPEDLVPVSDDETDESSRSATTITPTGRTPGTPNRDTTRPRGSSSGSTEPTR
ncbi:hypothetical protein ABFT43_20815 [Gordonia sp. B21]|uniref:hypothetical protein n=1 Tax=Gordonia sp. B21 TaxID=3151852 RepID=UPI0032671087